MPWRGPDPDGDEFPTLGHLVAQFVEASCAIPDGEHQGEPFRLTDEQYRFLLHHYRVKPDAKVERAKPSKAFVYRRSQLVRPQKWGKGPLTASLICAEAEGPVLFDGWDANGDPVGRPWATPWIQAAAASEGQTDNVWRALLPMIEYGAISADIADVGLTRINLPGGGYIEPVTASARSRLGQRVTFVVQDETHSWLESNGGRKLADNQRRNLAGMGGRSVETTNAWDPNEQSVAQQTYESSAVDVYRDFPDTPEGDLSNPKQRPIVLRAAYGDSWWVDLERIEAEYLEIAERDPAQGERFFANRIHVGSDRAFDADRWAELTSARRQVKRREWVTLGFDGALFHDATALVATHVKTGHQWPVGIWENPGQVDWQIDTAEVDAAVEQAFSTWRVWRMYADPPYWQDWVATWQGRYGRDRVVPWWTNRYKPMAWALDNYLSAVRDGSLTHDGDPTFAAHIGNAVRWYVNVKDEETGRRLFVIRKERPDSPLKIDAAMAGCLSWEARSDAVKAGLLKKGSGGTVAI